MKYIINQFKWDENSNLKYYHLVNSKEFDSDKIIPEVGYHKGEFYFIINKIDNDIQTRIRRK